MDYYLLTHATDTITLLSLPAHLLTFVPYWYIGIVPLYSYVMNQSATERKQVNKFFTP